MRNSLLASTALVGAAALLAAPAAAEVKVSAFSEFHASVLDQDASVASGTQDFDFSTNNEVNFSGSHTLDNGLTFGFQVQLEAASGSGGIIDENDIWVSGSFGKVVFGNQDGAANDLMVQASAVGVSFGGVGNPTFSGVTSLLVSGFEALSSSDVKDSSDAVKITYYTPRFNGIQAGVSYAPDLDSAGNNWDGGPGTKLEDFVELGINYSETINGVGIDAGLVGIFADSPIGEDRTGIGGGLKLSFGGFSVAAGYAQTEDDGPTGDTLDLQVFDIGVGYSTGPWTVALAAAFSEDDVSGDEFTLYSGNINYQVGPGLRIYGTVSGGTVEDTGLPDNDYLVFTTGIRGSF